MGMNSMSVFLRICIRFLDPVPSFCGQRDDNEPEWPPSPLRVFQAFIDASASRWHGQRFDEHGVPALAWLEALPRPCIIAPSCHISVPFRISGPNNDMDAPASLWIKGKEPEKPHRPVDLRALKLVHRSFLLRRNEQDDLSLHYLFSLPDGQCTHLGVLKAAARSITHLGWGIDMVAADADVISEEDALALPGHRWRAVESGGVPLRVPKRGTLQDLIRKHKDFLNRMTIDGFKPVPPLSEFRVVNYHSDTAYGSVLPGRPYAAFRLMTPDGEGTKSFSLFNGSRNIAGLTRRLIADTAIRFGFTPNEVRALVQGHAEDSTPLRGEGANQRLQFLPLPTINSTLHRVERIRRILIAGPLGEVERIRQIQHRLSGELLIHGEQPQAMLEPLPKSDWVLQRYVGNSAVWSTVVPAVFPGHHKGDLEKGTELAHRMFEHAGLPDPIELQWRSVGFRPGAGLANRYERPDKLVGSMFHLRVRFARPITGPLAIGAGRFRGFGLLAREEQ